MGRDMGSGGRGWVFSGLPAKYCLQRRDQPPGLQADPGTPVAGRAM